jgi:hypothetical protein
MNQCSIRNPNISRSALLEELIRTLVAQRFKHIFVPVTAAVGLVVALASPVGVLASSQNTSPVPSAFVRKVTVVADSTLDAPARYGIQKLEGALRDKGIAVNEGGKSLGDSDLTILAGLGTGPGAAADALAEIKSPPPSGAEALTIRIGIAYEGRPAIILAGSDGNGLMYAALDLSDRIGWSENSGNPFQFAQNADEKPFLKERGVAMFTMNKSYFESRLLDQQFWVRYFDMLAADRFNCLVLTFGYEDGGYMAPLYPYFYDVDGFPEVHVVGLTPEQQKHNLAAFKNMLHLAEERGIHVKPGIWEHIYRGPQRGQTGANGVGPRCKEPCSIYRCCPQEIL